MVESSPALPAPGWWVSIARPGGDARNRLPTLIARKIAAEAPPKNLTMSKGRKAESSDLVII
jgi:hypothetical protein